MTMTDPRQDPVRIDIAGIAVAIEIEDDPMRAAVRARYAEFIVASVEPQVTARVKVSAGARFVPLRSGPWVIELEEEGDRLGYRSHFDAGWIDIKAGNAFLEIAPEADIENFLRVLYARLCLGAGGLLLHAAGIVRDEAGFVFFGPSGSGKTTSARLSLEHTVLSDDLVIVKIDGDGVRVYGVPFRGDFPEAPRVNRSADLRGLFTLVKAAEHAVAPVRPPEAMARLLSCAPFVMTDVARARRAMEIGLQITERVPVRALHFRLDSGFWGLLNEF